MTKCQHCDADILSTSQPEREMSVLTDATVLADEYEAGLQKCMASGYEEYGPEFQKRQQLIIKALRAYARAASQPNRMGTTPEMQKMYDEFGGEETVREALVLAREWMEALTKSYSKKYGQAEYVAALAKIDAVLAQPASPLRGRDSELRDAARPLFDDVTRISQCLADANWRPSRAHIEGARNTMQQVFTALGRLASRPEQPAADPVTDARRRAAERLDPYKNMDDAS